jgi:hypothetical protein
VPLVLQIDERCRDLLEGKRYGLQAAMPILPSRLSELHRGVSHEAVLKAAFDGRSRFRRASPEQGGIFDQQMKQRVIGGGHRPAQARLARARALIRSEMLRLLQ